MKHDLEAILFATDSPVTMPRLKSLFPGVSGKELREMITALTTEYATQERAFTIVEFGGGWQIASRPEFAPLIEKLFRGRRFSRLSKAALEVLAIIAYRQPITRMEIEDVRGVQCSGVLTTLSERNLITVAGRAETVGYPLLYGTTREFLNHLGLRGLNQLPRLPEIEGILSNRDELRRFATQLGEDLSDTDFELLSSEDEAVPEESELLEAATAGDLQTEADLGDEPAEV